MKLFKRQQYERPTGKFQCGRAACWDKPCFNGPKPDGSCGGVTECTPIRRGDHWDCCRSAAAGGPCAAGPNPDGSCCLTRPPCVPRLTLRAKRGRITLLLSIVVVAALAAWFHFGSPRGPLASVNPGPLSGVHQNLPGILFTNGAHAGGGDIHNCSLCHSAHDAGAAGWIAAAFQPSKMSGQCLACHHFGDANNAAIQNKEHNQIFAHPSKTPDTQCQMCHTEHHGVKASPISITDNQCNICHTRTIHSFAKDHPAFADNFPHRQFASIRFDHGTHAKNYFPSKSAEFTCSQCHAAVGGQRGVTTASFEQSCARCHLDNIPGNNLPVLHLDPSNPVNTPFNKLLLADGKTADSFYKDVARSGNTLQTRLQSATGQADLKPLFRGLDWNAVKNAVAMMLKNPNAAANIPASAGDGWLVTSDTEDGLPELRYHASAHADSVMKAWLEFSLRSPSEFQAAMLNSKTGPGACAKCHVAMPAKSAATVAWRAPAAPAGHTVFSHGTHLKFLNDCAACHVVNGSADLSKQFAAKVNLLQADAKPVSSFTGIKLETCSKCHAEQKIAEDCRLCHRYHLEPKLMTPGQSPILASATTPAVSDQKTHLEAPTTIAPEKPSPAQMAAVNQSANNLAATKAAPDKIAADKAAADKAAADKAAAERAAAVKIAADKAAAAQAATAKLAADKIAADKAAADKLAAQKAPPPAVKPPPTPPVAPAAPAPAPAPAVVAQPARFHGQFVGNAECKNCHANEAGVWDASRHAKSFDLRRGGQKVKDILAAVGDKTRANEQPICQSCHFTMIENKAALGVSCESCHGEASDWITIHNDKDKIPDKAKRMDLARTKGMIGPTMKQDLLQNCLGCHNYDNGKVAGDVIDKMLKAGHPPFAFEFVSFSQGGDPGGVRHRFYPPTPDVNAPMTPVELARWFVIGQGAQLVSSVRVLAVDSGVDVIKTSQQTKISDATKILNLIDLPEAKALIAAPTDDNLTKLITACDGKDFTAKVGSSVPTTFK